MLEECLVIRPVILRAVCCRSVYWLPISGGQPWRLYFYAVVPILYTTPLLAFSVSGFFSGVNDNNVYFYYTDSSG